MSNSSSLLTLSLIITAFALVATVSASAKVSRLAVAQTAPDLPVRDAFGKAIHVPSAEGRVILLSFFRNAGCPVCRLRFQELEQSADLLRRNNITSVAVFESDPVRLRTYLENTIPSTRLVGDPELALYRAYGVERSWGGVFRAMFHGMFGKVSAGKKLFSKPQEQDGNMNRIEAEFLIDARGRILFAHYGAYVGDFTPVAKLVELAQQAKTAE